jgi:hypothetical protein
MMRYAWICVAICLISLAQGCGYVNQATQQVTCKTCNGKGLCWWCGGKYLRPRDTRACFPPPPLLAGIQDRGGMAERPLHNRLAAILLFGLHTVVSGLHGP